MTPHTSNVIFKFRLQHKLYHFYCRRVFNARESCFVCYAHLLGVVLHVRITQACTQAQRGRTGFYIGFLLRLRRNLSRFRRVVRGCRARIIEKTENNGF